MTMSDQEIESEMEFAKELMDDALTDLEQDTVPANRVASTYKSVARDARDIGIYQLALGNHEVAADWFEQSATYYLRGIDEARDRRRRATSPQEAYWENEPKNLRDALYVALLSHSEATLTEAVDETLAMDESFVTEYPEGTPWYYYAKALAMTIAGDDRAPEYLDDLESDAGKADSDVIPFFEAAIAVLEGILSADRKSTRQGLGELLHQYGEDIGEEPTTAIETIDIETTALSRLAESEGTGVSIESQYVPEMYS